MFKGIRGSLFLTIFFVLFLGGGTIAIAVRGELINEPGNIFVQPIAQIIVPGNILVYIVSLIVIQSVTNIELVVGTLKVLLVFFISAFLDFSVRTILSLKFKIANESSGPYAILVALCCFFCILFPTYRSKYVFFNEKKAMLALIVIVGLFNDLLSLASMLCGFLTFVFLAPFIVKEEEEDVEENKAKKE